MVRAALIIGVALSAVQGTALADTAQAEVGRKGFTIGASIGAGAISQQCDDCDTLAGPAVEFHIGWLVTPRLAILYDGSGVMSGDAFGSEMSTLLSAAAQYWLTPRTWLKAGAGVSRLELREGVLGRDETSESGYGALVAGGYEVYRMQRATIDAQLRVTASAFDSGTTVNTSLQVGVSWY